MSNCEKCHHDCHCKEELHSDAYGLCACKKCECRSKAEDKNYEKATASAVFKGDEKEIAAGAKNGWKYLKRSHEHFQGLGAISIGLILLRFDLEYYFYILTI